MALVHVLLLAVVPVALILQLITPLVLNIPLIAFCLLAWVFAVWAFRRARARKKFPVFSGFMLAVQSLFLLTSLAILGVITIPNESAGDSPAVVQGIRQFLVSHGLIEKPKTIAPPIATGSAESKPVETLNAPDAAKVEIKIEDDPKPKEEAGKP